MNYRFIPLFLFLILLSSMAIQSQTTTNVEALNQLSIQFASEWEASQERVKQYALDHNVPIRQELEDGRAVEMVDVREGKPVYYVTDNLGAAQTTRATELWEGGSTGLNLSGEGYDQLGEWDAGNVRRTHQEFTDQGASRVTQMDGAGSTHYHATHVAGTLVAAGVKATAKGMSFQAELKAYRWDNDESEMAAAAANGLELSNHSYGTPAGWENYGGWQWLGNSSISPTEDYAFGFYDYTSREMDMIAYNAPYYLICRSAGNERNEGPGYAGTDGNPEIDGGTDGYDCISPVKLGKNILTVGAVREVANYTGPESVVMSTFSSWGPADDGRIKPDIVGKGVDVHSTMDDSNTAYSNLNGTSMSTPNVTGTLALLQHYYQSIHDGTPMLAATLKALAIHTADEAGAHEGPDYIFGWGLMNAERAANKITEDTIQNVMEEMVLANGETYSREVSIPEGTNLRVTICWTDVPGMPVAAALNPRNPMLVNNLQLTVTDENDNTFYPYLLDPDNPSAAATNDGHNNIDNVEMVYAMNLPGGQYTITVGHEGTLENDEQAFSMIITGIDEYTVPPLCSNELLNPEDNGMDVLLNETISWQPAQFATSYDLYFGTDGGGTETPTNIYNGENVTENGFTYYMDASTTYYLQVVPRNSFGAAEDCAQIWSFTSVDAIEEYPFFEDMSETETPLIPATWQTYEASEAVWQSVNQAGHNDNKSVLCFNPEGLVETSYDNWFITPPLSVEDGMEYSVSFYFKNIMSSNSESMSVYWGTMPYPEDLSNPVASFLDFEYSDWEQGKGLIVPEESGLIYIGWHAESNPGLGIFLDDVLVQDFGPVGLEDSENNRSLNVFSRSNSIVVAASPSWENSEVKVMNLLGQQVYQSNLTGSTLTIEGLRGGSVYLVSIQKGNMIETKKVLVR